MSGHRGVWSRSNKPYPGEAASLGAMGQEISDSNFDDAAFAEFRDRLEQETRLLGTWLTQGRLQSRARRFGFEIEGWLVDAQGRPVPRNREFLAAVKDPYVVPELARFNFEINSDPLLLASGALDAVHKALLEHWQCCRMAADGLGLRPILTGILPTVRSSDLSLKNMSPLQRYQAINDQIFRLRHGAPIEVDIAGDEHLLHRHDDVMLEAATTSLQIHVEVDATEAARAFNVCKMLSAITVGAGANSPFLFRHRLWDETRIPLFEQSVGVGGSDYSKRVTFGVRYADEGIIECFEANCRRYPVILPDLMDSPPEELAHLRLHNGTIWRWNRPLIGFSGGGEPHCRIEHRVVAAGPTPRDAIANTALFLGLFEALMRSSERWEDLMPFEAAYANFYAAARHGLAAPICWMGSAPQALADLLLSDLLELAVEGLGLAGISSSEAKRWLAVIRGRAQEQMNGAAWQRAWVDKHGRDFVGLVTAYAKHQDSNQAVYQWGLS